MRFTILFIMLACISGCGVQGDLYLPTEEKPAPRSKKPVIDTDDDWSNPGDDNLLDDSRI